MKETDLPPYKEYLWRTVCPNRNVTDKVHNSLGAAKNAITGSFPDADSIKGYLYELVDGSWVLIHTATASNPKPWGETAEEIRYKARVEEWKATSLAEKHQEWAEELRTAGWTVTKNGDTNF